jgi:hypothetical protein
MRHPEEQAAILRRIGWFVVALVGALAIWWWAMPETVEKKLFGQEPVETILEYAMR